MTTGAVPATSREWPAEAERIVAWLRLPAIALLALSGGLPHPSPQRDSFLIVLSLFSAWSAALFAWTHLRPAGPRLALAATAVDVVAISVLASLSGGPFSHVRLAYFLIPVTVAFRFRPAITTAAAGLTTAAYVIQAVSHSATAEPHANRFIATQAGFLLWIGVACVLLSTLLARRTELVTRLADGRTRLLADALSAEQRERRALAEALHDHTIQNLLSARHDLDEAGEVVSHAGLGRADAALAESVGQLRETVFELHPYVLDEAGLEAALRSVAQRAAERAGLKLQLDLRYGERHPHEQLLYSAARELLANVVRHANASRVTVRLAELEGALVLVVEDDGDGFPPERLSERLATGHVGVASQRVRIEAAGGTMAIDSEPGRGTRVEVRLPGTG